jgi:hypothetical protein
MRKNIIDRTLPREQSKKSNASVRGIFSWVKVLKKVGDDDLRQICGTDAALYLIFLRYASKFFFVITACSLLIVIPIYLSGVPDVKDSPTDLV